MSRSFSEIVRFDFGSARSYNPYGIRIFLFMMIQLVLRALGIWAIFHFGPQRLQYLVIGDAIVSLLLFLVFFRPFLIVTLQQL